MLKYIIKRILLLIPVLLGVSLVIFTIMYFVPGDPAKIILGTANVTEEILEAKRVELGLRDPFIVQFGRFLKQTFIDFDFGQSYITRTPVATEIMARYPKTLLLAVCCMVLQIVIGIPLGIVAATHRNGIADRFCILVTILGISLPQFWVALMLVMLFSLKLHLLPAFGFGGIKYLILPVISLALNGISTIARLTRTSMLEVIRSDYVTTARAKGLKQNRIILVHALPNSIIPVIQSLGTSFGSCLGGAVVIENIFSIAGMGAYLTTGINNLDYPVIRSTVIVLALSFAVVMILVDLVFAFIDPRIKAQYSSQGRKRGKKVTANA
ncbi:MAG: ABC transporter permease [Oscillospiraceae bacterium]